MEPHAVIDQDVVVGGPYIPYHTNLTLTEIVRDIRAPVVMIGFYRSCEVHGHEETTSYYSHQISPISAGCIALLEFICLVPKSHEATTLFLESQLEKEQIIDLLAKGLVDYTAEHGYRASEKAKHARYNFSV